MEHPAHFAHVDHTANHLVPSSLCGTSPLCFALPLFVRPPVRTCQVSLWPPHIPQSHDYYGQTFHFYTITSPSSEPNVASQQGNLDAPHFITSRIRTLPDLSCCTHRTRRWIFAVDQFRPTTELNGLIAHVKRRSRMHLLQRVHLASSAHARLFALTCTHLSQDIVPFSLSRTLIYLHLAFNLPK
jgi:hypothetical protein